MSNGYVTVNHEAKARVGAGAVHKNEGEARRSLEQTGWTHEKFGVLPFDEAKSKGYSGVHESLHFRDVADSVERVVKRVDAITATKLTPKKHYLETHQVYDRGSPRGVKEVKAQAYDVHHEGKRLGSVSTYTGEGKIKHHGVSLSDGKPKLKWAAEPPEGEINGKYVGSSRQHGSRQSAVDQLKRWHGLA